MKWLEKYGFHGKYFTKFYLNGLEEALARSKNL